MTAREEMLSLISDLHKDAFGFRPRVNYSTFTDAQLEKEWDYLIIQLQFTIESEERAHAEARARYDAHIYQLMIDHGISKADAIRWDLNGEHDVDYHMWAWGLSLQDTREIREEMK